MAPRGLLTNRWANGVAILLNCICAGAIFTFPLFAPPFSRNLGLSMQQTSTLASAAILGEYVAAVGWGFVADRHGPGSVSFAAAALFGVGFGMLGWRYQVSVALQQAGLPLPQGQWIFLCGYYFLTGCATAASYFSSIIASTKSYPARHSGLAIGIPCSTFGLSPLFLSSLATFFTSTAEATTFGASNGELDPGRWLLFLAALLFVVNTIGGFVLKELPWDDDHEVRRGRVEDSGFVASVSPSLSDDVEPSERTSLLPTTTVTRPASFAEPSQSLSTFLRQPSFWLFGLVILLSIGPCEMVMASLGGVVESLLGFHILPSSPDSASRALGLRRLHVQIISVANTLSRLLAGAVSDWLSYSAAPSPPPTRSPSPAPAPGSHGHARSHSRSESIQNSIKEYFHTPPRLSRLAFILGSTSLLAVAFAYVATALEVPAGLWVLSVSVGVAYGIIFTLAPAVVRTVYPPANFGRNFGLLNWFSALGALIFTPMYGALSDLASARQKAKNGVCFGRECWHDIFLVSACSTAVAGVLVIILWRGWWRGKV